MTGSKQDVVEAILLRGYNLRDIEAMIDHVHPEVEWIPPLIATSSQGVPLATEVAWLRDFRDGRVVRMEIFHDLKEALAAAGAAG